MKKIEHIGIAVRDLKKSNEVFSKLLNTIPYKTEIVESEKVATSFFRMGPNKIELLEGISEDSAISKFIDKYGEGIHHIAFDVDDIENEVTRLRSLGFEVIGEEFKTGADHKIIRFLHPKSCNGVLIELCQENKS